MGEPTLKEKAWEPSFEEGILAAWKAEPDLYRFVPVRGQSAYVIDTPPPYPSGSWHVGAVMAYSMIDMIARTANGRLTAAEALGHREYVLTKLYRSA